MKKAIIIGTLGLIVVLVGCNGSNNLKKHAKETINVETKIEDEKIVIDNFTKILDSKDTLKVKEFILSNIRNVSNENADKMIIAYENLLRMNFEEISNKCISGKYKTIIQEAKKQDGSLDFEKIKNEDYRAEVKDIISAGYILKIEEGDYYLYIDYSMLYNTFSKYLSSKLKPYYALRKRELDKPIFIEEYLNVDFKEVKERAVILENFINNNKDFKNKDDVKLLMTRYTLGLLSIDNMSKTLSSETGKVEEIVKITYEELKESDLIISKQAAIAMDSLLEKYKYVIKPSDKDAIKNINELKVKIGNQVAQKVEDELIK